MSSITKAALLKKRKKQYRYFLEFFRGRHQDSVLETHHDRVLTLYATGEEKMQQRLQEAKVEVEAGNLDADFIRVWVHELSRESPQMVTFLRDTSHVR